MSQLVPTTELKRCYDRLLASHPKAQGDALLRITLPPGERFPSAKLITAVTHDDEFRGCVLNVVHRQEFPTVRREMVIDYPLALESTTPRCFLMQPSEGYPIREVPVYIRDQRAR